VSYTSQTYEFHKWWRQQQH